MLARTTAPFVRSIGRVLAKTWPPPRRLPYDAQPVLSIVVTDKSGAKRLLEFDKNEVTIGRLENNDIVLPKNNVSKRHSQFALKEGRAVVSDLKSTNGTYVNGRRIAAPLVLKPGDKVYIGDFILTVEAHAGSSETMAVSPVIIDPLRTTAEHARDRLLMNADTAHHEPVPGATKPGSLPPPPPMPSLRSPALADSLRKRAKSEDTVATRPVLVDASQGQASKSIPPPPPGSAHSGLTEGTVSMPFPTLEDPPSAPIAKRQDSGVISAREHETRERAAQTPSTPPPRPSSPPGRTSSRPSFPPSRVEDPESSTGPRTSPAVLTPSVRLQGALRSLMERLTQHVDVFAPRESAFSTHNGTVLESLIDELAAEGVVSADLDRVFLRDAAISEAFGLGPLDRLLANSSVREIVIDGPSRIMVDMGGGLSTVSAFLSSKQALLCIAQRLMARGGEVFEERVPMQECVLPNGSYVQVLLPPLAVRGPLLSIRSAPRMPLNIESLVTQDMLSNDMASLLRAAVRKHRNVVVLGAAGVGVTTALGVLSSLALDHERVVTIEDVPALTLDHPNALPMRRPPQLSLEDLLRRVARLRCDLLAIDDVRGDTTRDVLLLGAERTGVLIGMHAQSIAMALQQIEIFSRIPHAATLIAQAVHVLVHVAIDRDGVRRVVSIAEVVGARDEALTVRELYRFDGSFRPTEHRASFL